MAPTSTRARSRSRSRSRTRTRNAHTRAHTLLNKARFICVLYIAVKCTIVQYTIRVLHNTFTWVDLPTQVKGVVLPAPDRRTGKMEVPKEVDEHISQLFAWIVAGDNVTGEPPAYTPLDLINRQIWWFRRVPGSCVVHICARAYTRAHHGTTQEPATVLTRRNRQICRGGFAGEY